MEKLKNMTCVGCSLLCDDIMIETKNGEIEHVYHACGKGFQHIKGIQNEKRFLKGKIRENGEFREVQVQDAIEKAIKLIKNSKRVMIYGLNNSSDETIETALKLAEKLESNVDSSASYYKGDAILEIINQDLSVAPFEEIRDKGDTIILWGTNPSSSHSRLSSRYAILTRGELTQKGKEDRYVTLIDIRRTEMRHLSDYFYQIEPDQDGQLLEALISKIDGKSVPNEPIAGLSKEDIDEIIKTLKRIDLGVIFFGTGLLGSTKRNLPLLMELVKKINARKPVISLMTTPVHANTIGFVKKMKDKTNALNFNFQTKSPKSLVDLLETSEVDLLILVNSDPVEHFPEKITEKIKKLPIISLASHPNLTTRHARIIIPTSMYGIETGGTFHRMDSTEIRIISCLKAPTQVPTEDDVLKEILNSL